MLDDEKNVFNLENEDDILNVDEHNNVHKLEEEIRLKSEVFSVPEDNIRYQEENIIRANNNYNESSNNNNLNNSNASGIAGAANANIFSKTGKTVLHGLGFPTIFGGIAVTLVGAVAIIGSTSNTFTNISNSTNNVSVFMAKSNELGFSIEKDPNKVYIISLSNGEDIFQEEIIEKSQVSFSSLKPGTTYNLSIYDITDDYNEDTQVLINRNEYDYSSSKVVYYANYKTAEYDKYEVSTDITHKDGNTMTFSLNIDSDDIDFITVRVLGDNSQTIYLYEGSYKEEFTVEIGENEDVSCRVSINGKVAHFNQFVDPDYTHVESISLNEENLTCEVGDQIVLNATVSPDSATNKDVIWTSSNTSVAVVDENGAVSILGAGNVSITATTADLGFTATCSITAIVSETSVELDKTTLSIGIGDTSELSATINPSDATDKTITWSSSNTSVATVDSNGVVTAISAGTATITASSTNGKTATCEVTVSAPGVILVQSLEIDSTANCQVGEQYEYLVVFTPEDATNKNLTVVSSNTSVATVTVGDQYAFGTAIAVVPVSPGVTTITITAADGSGVSTTITITVS